MNQFNNENLPYFRKIVGIKFDTKPDNIEKIIEHIVLALKTLYGIIFLLMPDEKSFIVTNNNVEKSTINTARTLLETPFLEDEIDIIPFPK